MMLDRFLDWIESRGGKREIMRNGEKYLTRYYILRTKYLTVLIHKFWASDPDELHDHPWSWASCMLRGGYWEHEVDGTKKWRNDGWKFRRAEEFHRISVADGYEGYTSTLFITFKRRRSWGFLRGVKWINAKTYDRQPVEIEGRDFVIEGKLFPRIRYCLHTEKGNA